MQRALDSLVGLQLAGCFDHMQVPDWPHLIRLAA
jgi:hypothetical protein